MSDAPPGPGDLQFDRAEPGKEAGAPVLACAACKRPIGGDYYTAGPQPVCPGCRGALLASLEGGSGFARFAKAVILGSLAAGAGAGIYYAISALTGYEFGLVAIIVGLMVGAAVRKGAEGRGGWRYQLLAMALTYVAIVSTYIPFIVEAARKHQSPPPAASKEAPIVETPVPEKPSSPPPKERTAGGGILPLALLAGLALAAPFLAGLQNIIGLVIIGFALYEAWAMNRKVRVELAGPFRAPGANP